MGKKIKQCRNCVWRLNRAVKTGFAKEISGHPRFLCCFFSRTVELEDSCSNWIGYYGDPVQLPIIYTPSYFNLEPDLVPEDLIAPDVSFPSK